MEVVIVVPHSKAVAFAAALGGASRSVKLKEFPNRDLCGGRTLVVLSNKMGVFYLSLADACLQQRFVVKEEYMDWFVFPAVSSEVLPRFRKDKPIHVLLLHHKSLLKTRICQR